MLYLLGLDLCLDHNPRRNIMTTTNVEVRELPKPGTIIFVQDSSDATDSLFGLTTTEEFFRQNASERALKYFYDPEYILKRYINIPILVMQEDFSWKLCFRQSSHTRSFVSVFDHPDVLNKHLDEIYCFTFRDGSRYYAKYFRHILYYLKFLSGEYKIEDFPYMRVENPLERKFVESLMKWQEEQKTE